MTESIDGGNSTSSKIDNTFISLRKRNGRFQSEVKPFEEQGTPLTQKSKDTLDFSNSRIKDSERFGALKQPIHHHTLSMRQRANANIGVQKQNHPQSDRFIIYPQGSITTEDTLYDDLNDNSTVTIGGGMVSYNRFKNSNGVALATQGVRRSLNEVAQQIKKSKEIHELMIERKNIENMIVNSKLWSPPFSTGEAAVTQGTMRSTDYNKPFTTNVFRDKREELTKILKKRLNYIHQQSAQQTGKSPSDVLQTPQRGSMPNPLGSSPQASHGRRSYRSHNLQQSPGNASVYSTVTSSKKNSIAGLQQSYDFGASSDEQKLISNHVSKFPGIQQHKSRRNDQLVPGKGGNPFMSKTKRDVSPEKKLQQQSPRNQVIEKDITQLLPPVIVDPIEKHVDEVINDERFKKGLQEQLNYTILSQSQTLKDQSAKPAILLIQQSQETTKETPHGGNTSLQRQMVYQSDFTMKVGQINKRMDEEFQSLDQAMDHLKLLKPHQLGMNFPSSGNQQHQVNPFKHAQTKGRGKKGNGFDSGLKSVSDSLNYMMKSQIDDLVEPLQDQMHYDQIKNFAVKLMRQRRQLASGARLNRGDSFNTEMGMAYSAKNDQDDTHKDHHAYMDEESDEEGSASTKIVHPAKAVIQEQIFLESERGIKRQEQEFVKKMQNLLVKEFDISGEILSPRQSSESPFGYKKIKTQRFGNSEIPPVLEAYMKNMKIQTMEGLTQDVKARNNFFQFIRHHQNAVFLEKFLSDPKLNYFLQCNKEFVLALPTISKIQSKTLSLVGYRLNAGVCKALRVYMEQFRNAITKITLDNNGITSGEVLAELLEGVKAQDDFKQIVIIRNSIDERSIAIIDEMLQRNFSKCLEELRIINCKISQASTYKILNTIYEGNSQLRKLSLAASQINEQSLGLLAGIVTYVRSLVDLDISWNGLRPNANFKKFLEALGANRSIQYLNLSWNNLMLPTITQKEQMPSPRASQVGGSTDPEDEVQITPMKKEAPLKLDEYTEHLLQSLLKFIKYNRHLIHLDLSYTRLDEPMIIALGTALRRAKSLVAVHLTGNPGVTQTSIEYLHERVHCRPHFERQTKRENQALLQTMQFQNTRQNKAFEGLQLKQIMNKQRLLRNTTGGHAFQPEIDEGKYLQFQRWLGHKIEIPRCGQWQQNSAFQELKDDCWVCNKWSYTVVYWSPIIQYQITRIMKGDPQLGDDYEELEQVQQMLRVGHQEPSGKAPIIAGSFTNWEVREMTPIVQFCELIDTNPPDPIQMLHKSGRIREEVQTEADLKTDKELLQLEKVKAQIKQDYKQKWKPFVMKNLKYKKACHVNIDFASDLDLRTEELYLFVIFAHPGQHLYYIKDQDSNEFLNKCIVPLREEEIHIHEKANKTKVTQRVFKKENSVFKDWKEDTPQLLQTMFGDDIKWWKISRFVKDDVDRERVERVLQKNFLKIKWIFTSFISQSSFPNISWIDFGNFCEKCKIIDGKGVTLATVDRAFIAANVAVDGQKLSEDNPTNALSRFEFLEILLRLAQSKYKETGICATYEDSMIKLLEEHVFPLANPEPWQEFRDELLWTIDVNDVLEVNLEGLKKVYTYYQEPRKKNMTMTDALNLMMKDTQLGLIEKDAIYCFGMCKMSVIYEQENMWQYKHLKFVELLELIGRIAHQKFKDHPELSESLSLAQKIEHVLDIVFKMVEVNRKDVHNNVLEESESDDEY